MTREGVSEPTELELVSVFTIGIARKATRRHLRNQHRWPLSRTPSTSGCLGVANRREMSGKEMFYEELLLYLLRHCFD
jgi:hypothetical protein